ncbi:MAG TPA: EF-hand domain-containing protein [Caulobacteraceae bacterium]
MTKTLILAGVAALALGGAAFAQNAAPAADQAQARQMRADTDNDGRISRAEFVDARLQRLTALDTDNDGTIEREEAQAARQRARAEMRGRHFDRIDANDDGQISRAEFDAAPAAGPRARPGRAGMARGHMMRMHRRHHAAQHGGQHAGVEGGPARTIAGAREHLTQAFDRMDADHDGYVTREERRAMVHERRGGRGPGQGR